MKRVILHVDMDAFYAAIEQHDNPALKGKPVVIGADPKEGSGRGVVSTCSYEARKYGIHSAMPISKAYKLNPGAVFIRPRMARYREVSDHIMDIFSRYSPSVEPLSLDEAFLDCSNSGRLLGTPVEIGEKIKAEIFRETGLTASVGIAANKSVAKIASDLHKPDGLTFCPEGEERHFLEKLDISKLWGVGKKSRERLIALGFLTVGDIAKAQPETMRSLMGKPGFWLWCMANGIDERDVARERSERKSMSLEVTFSSDLDDYSELVPTIKYLCDKLSWSLREEGLKARTVNLKLRYEGFETITRSFTFLNYVDDYTTLQQTVFDLMEKSPSSGRKIRLIGVGYTNLADADDEFQGDLFENSLANEEKKKDSIIDTMRGRFGFKVTRASLLEKPEKSCKKKR